MNRVLLIVLAVALLPAPATASAAPTATGTLYVQQAANASLMRAGSAWKLVLDRPDAHVIAFADRPARTGTAQRLAAFVRGWDAAFGGDPPNAALQVEGAPPSHDIALLELSAPHLSKGGHRLTYRARPLTATSATLGGLAQRADRGIHGRLGRVTLFIDDASTTTTGTLTVAATGLQPGQLLELNAIALAAGASAFVTASPFTYWGTQGGGVQVVCDAAASAPCSASLSVAVSAPDAPLTLQVGLASGSATLSWSGGPPQTVSGSGSVTLPPGP
jgi:hypothetical protein